MTRRLAISSIAGAALLLLPDLASAQINNQWVSYTKTPAKLAVAPTALSDNNTQILFRMADLDQDGWVDVVGARKSQASQVAPRKNVLLMNINGVLTDKTAQYAQASDVPGDLGFNTEANDRELAIGDVDGDGWLDVVTCVSLSDGKAKNLSHPRVYMNLGDDINGDWLGLRNEDARIPQLKTVGGMNVAPRFCGMGLADVTDDGAIDVYFVDYDTTETGIFENASWDLNDRLLVNDGNGFFTDESAARFTTTQLNSSFGADLVIVDLNNDGYNDVVKDSTLTSPLVVRALYNNPATPGNFKLTGTQDFGPSAPYGMELGSLNNDAFMDVAIADDGNDRFRLGTGFDGLNKMIWGPMKTYSFVTGGDDGFGHNVYMEDLDSNGWNDVLITDVDGDLLGCGRRGHIYHNTGSTPGDMNIVLKEESQFANGGTGTGWKGVVGMTAVDLKGSYDFAVHDFDKDGDEDMLLATCTGTNYWQNNLDPVPFLCQPDLGNGGPGTMNFTVCGDDLTFAGSTATLSVTGAVPNIALNLVLGLSNNPIPWQGGMLIPIPIVTIVTGLVADGSGNFSIPVNGGVNTPVHVIMQFVAKNGSVYELSNGVDMELGF